MNSWNTFWLLRPLIVFAIACPALIVGALLGLRKKDPDTGKSAAARADATPQVKVSGLGTWGTGTEPDSRSQAIASYKAESSTDKRAA